MITVESAGAMMNALDAMENTGRDLLMTNVVFAEATMSVLVAMEFRIPAKYTTFVENVMEMEKAAEHALQLHSTTTNVVFAVEMALLATAVTIWVVNMTAVESAMETTAPACVLSITVSQFRR